MHPQRSAHVSRPSTQQSLLFAAMLTEPPPVRRSASAFGSQPGSAALAEPGSTVFGPRGSGRLSADILPQQSAAAGLNSLATALTHQQPSMQQLHPPSLASGAGSTAGLLGPAQLLGQGAQQSLWGAGPAVSGSSQQQEFAHSLSSLNSKLAGAASSTQPCSAPIGGGLGSQGRTSPLSGSFGGGAALAAFGAPGSFVSSGGSYPAPSGLAASSVGRVSGGLPMATTGSSNAGGNQVQNPNYLQQHFAQQPGSGMFANSQHAQQQAQQQRMASDAPGGVANPLGGNLNDAAGSQNYSGGFGASAYTSFLNLLPQLHQQQSHQQQQLAQQPQLQAPLQQGSGGGPVGMSHSTQAGSVSRSSGFAQQGQHLY